MNKKELHDQLILKQDETALSLIKEMWAFSNLLYKKIDDRNHTIRYQFLKYNVIWSKLDYILYQMECMLDDEIKYMKQQIEKEKAETEKSDLKVVENRYDSTLNNERKKHKKKVKNEQNQTNVGFQHLKIIRKK